MLTALLLIFDPGRTWDRIEQTPRCIARVFFLFSLPLLLIPAALEAYGLIHLGKAQGFTNRVRPVAQDLVIRFEFAQLGFSLLILFAGALLVKLLAESFGRRHPYTDCFMTLAYSLGPLFLLRILNMIPQLNFWIPWALGIFLCLACFYRGLPRLLKPDPSNALGIYLLSAILLVAICGLPHYLCGLVLTGDLSLNI